MDNSEILLLSLLYVMFSCVYVIFPCDVLGQVWYLIVSIPDLCLLTYVYVMDPWLVIMVKHTLSKKNVALLFHPLWAAGVSSIVFVWFDALRPSQIYGHVGTVSSPYLGKLD